MNAHFQTFTLALQLIFVVTLLSESVGLAQQTAKSEVPTTVQIPVPQSQLYLPDLLSPTQKSVTQMDFAVSNWQPQSLQSQTVVSDRTEFSAGTASRFSLGLSNSQWAFEKLFLSPKIGLSYAQLQRRGSLELAGGRRYSITENLNLYSVRAGLEASNKIVPRDGFFIFGSAMLLPTWMQAPPTAFNRSGFSQSLLAGEVTAGIGYFSKDVSDWLGVESAGLTAGGEATGGLSDTSFTGYGITVGGRVGI